MVSKAARKKAAEKGWRTRRARWGKTGLPASKRAKKPKKKKKTKRRRK